MDELIQQLIDGEIGIEEFRTKATDLGITDVDGLLQALNLSGESIPAGALLPPTEPVSGDLEGGFGVLPTSRDVDPTGPLGQQAQIGPVPTTAPLQPLIRNRQPVQPRIQPFIGPPERPTAATRFTNVPPGVGAPIIDPVRTPTVRPVPGFTGTNAGIFSEENQQILDRPTSVASPILSEENIDVLQNERFDNTFARRAARFGGPNAPESFDATAFGEDPSNENAIFQAALARFDPTPNQENFFQARRGDIFNQFEGLRGQAAFEGRDPSRLSQSDFLRDFDFGAAFREATPTQRRSPGSNVSTPSSAFNPRLRRLN